MELTALTAQQQQLPLERLRQVPQDPTQQLQTVAAALLQRLTFLFLEAQQEPLVLKALLVRTAPMVRMEAQTLF